MSGEGIVGVGPVSVAYNYSDIPAPANNNYFSTNGCLYGQILDSSAENAPCGRVLMLRWSGEVGFSSAASRPGHLPAVSPFNFLQTMGMRCGCLF